MSVSRLFIRLLAAAVALLLAVGAPAPARADTSAPALADLTRQVLESYDARDASSDTRYFADGQWVNGEPGCWTCNVGPATAAAALATIGAPNAEMASLARQTFDRAIATKRRTDGSFTDPASDSSPGIDTSFFAADLGVAYLRMQGTLDAATRRRWARALAGAADYLIRHGDTVWYANGNINLRYTEVLYLAWKATGEPRFKDAYERSWAFTLAPARKHWAGYGLVTTKVPARADGADGAGYLAESAGGAPGFDAAYTEVQADVASSLWVASRDPRALRLLNLLVNQLRPRVDATGTLDATQGVRRDLMQPLMTPGVAVLVRGAGRTDLAGLLDVQRGRMAREYQGAMTFSHPNYYRGMSTWLATALLDAVGAKPAATMAPVAVARATAH